MDKETEITIIRFLLYLAAHDPRLFNPNGSFSHLMDMV